MSTSASRCAHEDTEYVPDTIIGKCECGKSQSQYNECDTDELTGIESIDYIIAGKINVQAVKSKKDLERSKNRIKGKYNSNSNARIARRQVCDDDEPDCL